MRSSPDVARSGRVAQIGGLIAAVTALATCAVAVPVYAFVSRNVQTVILPQPVHGYNNTSANATCPGNQHVQFGGFATKISAYHGMRRSADNQWTVDGDLGPSGSVPTRLTGRLTSIAYCASGRVPTKATNTKKITNVKNMPASGGVIATCPPGTVVLAGGFASSPSTEIFVKDLERAAADKWRVWVTLPYRASHTTLTAIAYCGPGPAPKLVSKRVTLSGGPPQTTRATCPVGTSLMFGGAIDKAVLPDQAYLLGMKAADQRTWSVTGQTSGGLNEDGAGYLTALAYCR